MQNAMMEPMAESKQTVPLKNNGKAARIAAKPYRRSRGGEAKQVADLMPEIGRAAFRRFGFVQSSIVSRWSEIVGRRYAEVSEPIYIRFPVGKKADGTLELIVVGAHATMMQHVFPEIIERVNRFFGYSAVARIKMRQGQIDRRAAIQQPSMPPSLKPLPMELGENLRDIADPELAAVLGSLARRLADRA